MRHAHNCKILAIVVDAACDFYACDPETRSPEIISLSASQPSPQEQIEIIVKEIEAYQERKSVACLDGGDIKDDSVTVVIANKIDVEGAYLNIDLLREHLSLPIFPVSAKTGEGIDDLINFLHDYLKSKKAKEEALLTSQI